jgi:hypothetical protein
MPDGRPLPHQAEFEPMEIVGSCEANIEGPPLSVQLREVTFPEGAASPLTINPNGAQLAYRYVVDPNGSGEPSKWAPVSDTTELEPPSGPMQIVAIMPSGDDLNAKISLDNSGGLTCACHIGTWMEQATAEGEAQDSFKGALEAIEKARAFVPPEQLEELEKAKRMISSSDTKDRFRFRGAAEQIFEMGGEGDVTYDNDGPIVTFKPGGSFIIEDPHRITGGKSTVNYHTYIHSGDWVIEDGVLKIDLQHFTYKGTVEGPVSDGPQNFGGDNKHSSYVGGGGDWIVSCEGSGVKLIPADRAERGPGKDAILEAH